MNRKLTLLIIAMSISLPLHAELYECNGMWTNHPCEGEVKAGHIMQEKAHQERSQAEQIADQKKLWVQDLQTDLSRAKRKYGISLSMGAAEELCRRQDTSLLDCRRELDTVQDKLDQRLASYEEQVRVRRTQEAARSQSAATAVYIDQPTRRRYRGALSHSEFAGRAQSRVYTGSSGVALNVGSASATYSTSTEIRSGEKTKSLVAPQSKILVGGSR